MVAEMAAALWSELGQGHHQERRLGAGFWAAAFSWVSFFFQSESWSAQRSLPQLGRSQERVHDRELPGSPGRACSSQSGG